MLVLAGCQIPRVWTQPHLRCIGLGLRRECRLVTHAKMTAGGSELHIKASSDHERASRHENQAGQSYKGRTFTLAPARSSKALIKLKSPISQAVCSRVEEVVTDSECSKSPCETPNPLSYQYDHIDPNKNHIRVLSININSADETWRDGDTISCTLETVSLDDWTLPYTVFDRALETVRAKRSVESDGIMTNHSRMVGSRFWKSMHTSMAYVDDNEFYSCKDIEGVRDRFNWGDYMALSYVWGDPALKERILVNNHPLGVTVNLYQALVRLRSSSEMKYRNLKVWIDAICINQGDLDERESMVRKMDTIYSEALCVRGWLGRPSTDIAADLPEVRKFLDGRLQHLKPSEISAYNDLDPHIAKSVLAVSSSLFQEKYWERLWIMQEIALASSLVFWYGDSFYRPAEIKTLIELASTTVKSTIDYSVWILGDHVAKFDSLSKEVAAVVPHLKAAALWSRILQLRPEALSGPTAEPSMVFTKMIPLVEIIGLSQFSKATDQRDKVYGLLALLPDVISSRIRPTYEKGVDSTAIYSLFSSVCIQEGNLNTLARTPPHISHSKGLPSWAFDLDGPPFFGCQSDDVIQKDFLRWQVLPNSNKGTKDDLSRWQEVVRQLRSPEWMRVITQPHGGSGYFDIEQYKADGGLTPSISFSADLRILTCHGLFIDVIDSLGTGYGCGSIPYAGYGFRWSQTQRMINSRESFSSSGKSVSRLSLARLLMRDRKYKFSDGPSMLDIPWLSAEIFSSSDFSGAEDRYSLSEKRSKEAVSWVSLGESLKLLFERFLHQNATFRLGGVPLKDYFTSTLLSCPDPEVFASILERQAYLINQRLFTTAGGLIGTVVAQAIVGDKIAVLLGCDMPVVLRPRGNYYQYIGSCFAEGLMDGEAVGGFEVGKVKTEIISLC